MGFFNNLTKKTTETTSKIAKKTSKATSKIAKETKLKMKISENKGKISDLYEEIGKNVYEDHIKETGNLNTVIEENCAKIDELSSEIQELRKEILILKDKKQCQKCFEEIEASSAYCPKCGEKQTDEKTVFEKAQENIKEVEVLPKNEKKKEAVEIELKETIDETNNEKQK